MRTTGDRQSPCRARPPGKVSPKMDTSLPFGARIETPRSVAPTPPPASDLRAGDVGQFAFDRITTGHALPPGHRTYSHSPTGLLPAPVGSPNRGPNSLSTLGPFTSRLELCGIVLLAHSVSAPVRAGSHWLRLTAASPSAATVQCQCSTWLRPDAPASNCAGGANSLRNHPDPLPALSAE